MTTQRAALMLSRIRLTIDGDESYANYPDAEIADFPHPLELTWSDGDGLIERLRVGNYGTSAVRSVDGGATWEPTRLNSYGTMHDLYVKTTGPARQVARFETGATRITAYDEAGSAFGLLSIGEQLTFNAKSIAVCLGGTTGERPDNLTADNIGQQFWDSTLGKAVFWNGAAWKLADGTAA